MEPLTLATAFATFVSLLGQFKSEHRETTRDDLQAFFDFLSSQGHEEIRQLLETNQLSTVSLKAFLSQSTEQLLEKLEHLDQAMASLSPGMANLAEIAAVIHPESQLSEQAVGFLRQLHEKNASGFLFVTRQKDGPELIPLDGVKGALLNRPVVVLRAKNLNG